MRTTALVLAWLLQVVADGFLWLAGHLYSGSRRVRGMSL